MPFPHDLRAPCHADRVAHTSVWPQWTQRVVPGEFAGDFNVSHVPALSHLVILLCWRCGEEVGDADF